MDLGVKEKPIETQSSVEESTSEEPRINYPSAEFRDAVADELRKMGVEVDSEFTMTVSGRCSGDSKDRYSNRLTLEFHSADNVEVSDTDEDADGEETEGKESDGEEKVLGYKRPEKPEAPDTSAAALED